MKYNILVVAPGGGHLREAKIALEIIDNSEVLFITNPLPHLMKNQDENVRFIIDPHISIIKYMKNFIESISLFFKYYPSIIISTGGGISISLFIIGKIFNSKTIFIESGSRIQFPSRTGRLLYHFSDYFIIQSESLKKYYPKSTLII